MRQYVVRRLSLSFTIMVFAAGAGAASASDAISLLTIDGDVQSIAEIPQPQLRRIAAAEGGRNVVVDDYALVQQQAKGPQITYATDAFRVAPDNLAAVGKRMETAARSLQEHNTTAAVRAAPTRALRRTGLLVRHQSDHPAGHNFTPKPQTDFLPQVILADELEGQRGFAIVSVGETGSVLQVQLLTGAGRTRAPELRAAIASGVRTTFQDERRHDHTIYMAYEVGGHEVRRVGQSLVTLPMCCGGCQGICP
jgi:hypothetical protein